MYGAWMDNGRQRFVFEGAHGRIIIANDHSTAAARW